MKIPKILVGDLKRVFSLLGSRVFVLYLVVILAGGVIMNYRQGMVHARAAALSRHTPNSFNYLFAVEDAGLQGVDRARLSRYARYFEGLLENYSAVSDARGLLGFCYYYLGKEQKALEAYRTAVASMPRFFGFQYNLGAIYFKKGRYQEAAKSLTLALTADMFQNMDMTVSSRAFLPMLKYFPKESLQQHLLARLKSNYRQCFSLLIVSYYRLKKFPEMLYCARKAIEAGLEEDGIFYYYAGCAFQEIKDYKQALMFFETAVKKDPENADAYHRTGLCLQALGQNDIAAPVFEHEKVLRKTAVAQRPFDPQIKIVVF